MWRAGCLAQRTHNVVYVCARRLAFGVPSGEGAGPDACAEQVCMRALKPDTGARSRCQIKPSRRASIKRESSHFPCLIHVDDTGLEGDLGLRQLHRVAHGQHVRHLLPRRGDQVPRKVDGVLERLGRVAQRRARPGSAGTTIWCLAGEARSRCPCVSARLGAAAHRHLSSPTPHRKVDSVSSGSPSDSSAVAGLMVVTLHREHGLTLFHTTSSLLPPPLPARSAPTNRTVRHLRTSLPQAPQGPCCR